MVFSNDLKMYLIAALRAFVDKAMISGTNDLQALGLVLKELIQCSTATQFSTNTIQASSLSRDVVHEQRRGISQMRTGQQEHIH